VKDPPPPDGAAEAAAVEGEASLARSTLIMTIGTGLSRVTGVLRVTALAATLGITESKVADTYNLANTTPNVIYELVLGGILSSIFVPVFVQARKQEGREAAWHLARLVMTLTIVVLGALSLASILGASWIMRLYTLGVDDPALRAEQQRIGTLLLVMFLPQIVFYGVGAVMTGLLNANRRFGVPMFAPVLNNLTVIAVGVAYYLLVGGQAKQLDQLTFGDELLLGLGTTAGVVAMTMVQWPFLRRLGFRYRPAWDLRHPGLRRMAGLSVFTIGYVIVNQLAYLVVPILSNKVQGGNAAYAYAFMFFQLPHGLFAVSVMTALLPPMSEQALARDWGSFRVSLSQGIRLTAFVLVPATVGYLVLARPVVRLLLAHGNVGDASIDLVVRVVVLFVLGLVSFSVFQLVLRAFYALQDTRVPFTVNLVAAIVRVAVDVVLFFSLPGPWKVAGIAAGHGISYTVGSLLLLDRLRRRIGGLGAARILAATARIGLASLAMGVAAGAAAAAAGTLAGPGLARDLAMVTAGVVAGLLAYLLAARMLGVRELDAVRTMVRRRIGRTTAVS